MASPNLFFDINKRVEKLVDTELYSFVPFMSEKISDHLIRVMKESLLKNVKQFEAKLNDEGETEYIGRILEMKILDNVILFILQNGKKVLIYPKEMKMKMLDIVELVSRSDVLYLYLEKRRGRKVKGTNIVVTEIEPVIVKEANLSDILEYQKQNNLRTWELLLEGIGLKPDLDVLRLYLPRIISLFKIPLGANMNFYNHVLQLTLPGTGKTTFYTNLKFVANIEIFTTFPSRARLVMDARSGKLGSVFLRDLIVIDAFDKNLDRNRFEEFMQVAETGLSNAIWTVEKSSQKDIQEQAKHTGFSFLGNIEGSLDFRTISGDKISTTRKYLSNFMEAKGIHKNAIYAFLDRLAIVDICDTVIDFNAVGTGKMMKGPYLTTLLRYINDAATQTMVDFNKIDLGQRYRIYAARIAKILRVLEIEPAEEIATKLVKGDWSWFSLFKPEEIPQVQETREYDEYQYQGYLESLEEKDLIRPDELGF